MKPAIEVQRTYTGAPWESKAAYCRAIRAGNHLFVTGTAPVENGEVVFAGDPYRQARKCLEIIAGAIKPLGAEMRHIMRTRMFVTDISLWQEFAKAHHEVFKDFPPTTSMVEVKALVDPAMLIEIEADGIVF